MNLLETLFSWVVSTTIRASLVALAILATQMLLRPWLPAKWRHPLWMPLLLVMILPFVPTLPVHLIPARQVPAAPAATTMEVKAIPQTNAVEVAAAPAAATAQKAALLPLLWLLGACITMTAGITGYRQKLNAIRARAASPEPGLQAEIEEARQTAGLSKTPLVWLSHEVESPAVSGLLRPVLLLPAEFPSALNATETRLILLHEFSHIKRHDLAQNWLLFVLQALHWFNPVIWFAFARLRMDRESACDARVLVLDAQDRRSDYGHALLKMQDLPAVSGLRLGFLGIFENASGLRSRITDITRHRRSHPAWRVAGTSLVAVIALFGATRAQEPKPAKENAADAGKVTAKDAELTSGQAYLAKKLDTIMLPMASFENTSIEEAIDFVRLRSRELDAAEPDPAKKGLNFVIRKARGADGQEAWQPGRTTLKLKNVSLRRLLDEIAAQSGTRYSVDDFAVTFVPAAEKDAADKAAAAAPQGPPPSPKTMENLNAARGVVIPIVDFEDTTLEDAVVFFNLRAKELSKGAAVPTIKIGPNTKGDTRIKELRLRNVPLLEALRYCAEATKQTVSVDDEGVQIGK